MTTPSPHLDPVSDEVVLVSCYELGHEPLGLVIPAGVLARSGIKARLVDLAVEPFRPDVFARARLVAVSTPMHTALRTASRLAARVRTLNPDAHLCFFGLYAGLNRDHLVPGVADSAFGAEYEAPLLELADRIGVARSVPPRAVRPPEDADPARRSPGRAMSLVPARDAITHREHYARLVIGDSRREVGYVQTTRGCKHSCRHCPLPPSYQGTFYALPEDHVIQDIATLVERGARHITFADPDFLNGPGHALRIARTMASRFTGLTFDYTAKIEHLHGHLNVVDELQELGSVFVVTALESMNDTVLAQLNKGHSRSVALEVVRRFRRRGLALRPTLIPFTPWESRASFSELLDIVATEGLVDNIDAVQYSIRLLLPEGSLLLADETIAGCVDGFDREMMSYRWHHPDPGMDSLQRSIARAAEDMRNAGTTAPDQFERIRGLVGTGSRTPVTRGTGPTPHLTEDWFC